MSMTRPPKTTRPQNTKGVAVVASSLLFVMLIPVIGLGIDGSISFLMRAKLSRAVDAAALAAARAYSTGIDDEHISSVAYRYFDANFAPGEWGALNVQRTATPAYNPTTRVRSVTVAASLDSPLYFMRMLNHETVHISVTGAAQRRDVNVILIIDRSGSVQRAGNDGVIKNTLKDFVANTPASTPPGHSVFVNGSDVIGLVSYGGSWNPDFPPRRDFRTSTPNISTAINSIPFGNNATNTAEGLYQGYQQLLNIPASVPNGDLTHALNVLILLTDGRPSALTVTLDIQSAPCLVKGLKTGFISANVKAWPPPDAWGASSVYTFGLFQPRYAGLDPSFGDGGGANMVPGSTGCHYSSDADQSIPGNHLYLDIATFPDADAHGNSTTGPVYPLAAGVMSSPQAVRYASFNAADNQATTIRTDAVRKPLLFVIGLNENNGEEPLDADWLARLANDPNYKDVNGHSVFQEGQSEGMYFNVDAAGLPSAFQRIASEILHLSQ
jgi:Flp pilus assembly protein TadG